VIHTYIAAFIGVVDRAGVEVQDSIQAIELTAAR